MKILVYGAKSTVGRQFVYELTKAGNQVSTLYSVTEAQELSKHNSNKEGIFFEKEFLEFDLMFVLVQYENWDITLLKVAQYRNLKTIFVGDVLNMQETEQMMKILYPNREVAFSFYDMGMLYDNGKKRKKNKKTYFVIGGRNGSVSVELHRDLKKIFGDNNCKLVWENHMEEWVLRHISYSLPYLIGNLQKKEKWKDYSTISCLTRDATKEINRMLNLEGYHIGCYRKEDVDRFYSVKYIEFVYTIWNKIRKTKRNEDDIIYDIKAQVDRIEKIKKRVDIVMPAWDCLVMLMRKS